VRSCPGPPEAEEAGDLDEDGEALRKEREAQSTPPLRLEEEGRRRLEAGGVRRSTPGEHGAEGRR